MDTQSTTPPNRQQFHDYGAWRKAALRYIKANAPSEKIIFLRDVKVSKLWHRFVIPGGLFAIALLMFAGGYWTSQRHQSLVETGQYGNLIVTDKYDDNPKAGESWRLMASLDGVSTRVMGEYSNDEVADIEIGDEVYVLYRTDGMPMVWWGEDDLSSMPGLYVVAILTLGFSVWLLFGYKGAIEPTYREHALRELEAGRPLPL